MEQGQKTIGATVSQEFYEQIEDVVEDRQRSSGEEYTKAQFLREAVQTHLQNNTDYHRQRELLWLLRNMTSVAGMAGITLVVLAFTGLASDQLLRSGVVLLFVAASSFVMAYYGRVTWGMDT